MVTGTMRELAAAPAHRQRFWLVMVGVVTVLAGLQTIVDGIGESTTFILFAVICAASWIYIWRRVPETRGRSLHEIQQLWATSGP